MNLTRRSLFASAVALLALPRRVAAERLLGPVQPETRLYDSTVTRVTTWQIWPQGVTQVRFVMDGGVIRMTALTTKERANALNGTWRCG